MCNSQNDSLIKGHIHVTTVDLLAYFIVLSLSLFANDATTTPYYCILQAHMKGLSSTVTGAIFAVYPLVCSLASPLFGNFVSIPRHSFIQNTLILRRTQRLFLCRIWILGLLPELGMPLSVRRVIYNINYLQ